MYVWLQVTVCVCVGFFFSEPLSTLLHEYKDYTRALWGVFSHRQVFGLISMPVGSQIAVCCALFSLVATDILWICFTSFNRLCGLQLANLATQNHWKHEPLQHSPWPWHAFLTQPATLGKLRMYCLAACCCSVVNWPAMLVFQASQAASEYALEWDTCVRYVELQQLVKEDCLKEQHCACVCGSICRMRTLLSQYGPLKHWRCEECADIQG